MATKVGTMVISGKRFFTLCPSHHCFWTEWQKFLVYLFVFLLYARVAAIELINMTCHGLLNHVL